MTITEKIEKCIQKAEKQNATITILQDINESKQYSLWYGGTVANIHYRGYEIDISAIGDVYCTLELVTKDDEYIDDLCDVRDKCNMGQFNDEMQFYIHNDSELYELLKGNTIKLDKKYIPEKYVETYARLNLQNNNWWECSARTPDGKFIDLGWVMEEDKIEDAIETVIDTLDETIEYIKEAYTAFM